MKKLLRLDDMAKGGRGRDEIYDLLGMRVVVAPLPGTPPETAAIAATQASLAHDAGTVKFNRRAHHSCGAAGVVNGAGTVMGWPHPLGHPPDAVCMSLMLLKSTKLMAQLTCFYAQACYRVREVAMDLWEHVAERDKDYIAAPKANGYQSLHTTLRVPSLVVEASALCSLSPR